MKMRSILNTQTAFNRLAHWQQSSTSMRACPSLIPCHERGDSNLENSWQATRAGREVTRYTAEKVLRLRGTMKIEHTIADQMSRKFWDLLQHGAYVPALGALTGNQAVQMAQAGLKAIYLSGWQVAADANLFRNDVSRPESLSGPTACRWSCAASTRRCSAPTRSNA